MLNNENKQLEYERIVNNGLQRLKSKSIKDNPRYICSITELVKNMRCSRLIFIIAYFIAMAFGIGIFNGFGLVVTAICISGFITFGYASITFAIDFVEDKNILIKRLNEHPVQQVLNSMAHADPQHQLTEKATQATTTEK